MNMEPILPRGWTYLRHGTCKTRWPENFGQDFTVRGGMRGLSCVERKEALCAAASGFNTARGYAGKISPFEIRVLLYEDTGRLRNENTEYIKQKLTKEELREITSKYYNPSGDGQHPVVPNKTELIFLGQSSYDEISKTDGNIIFWYVPKQYLSHYRNDVKEISEQTKGLQK